MNDSSNKEQMLKDLRFIKEAVKKNNNILKYISVSEGIKAVALFSGIIIIGLSLIYLWIIDYYGSFNATPEKVKLTAYLLIGLSFVGLIWYKIKVFLKLGRRYKENMTLIMLIKEVYTRTLLMIMIPFLLTIVVFCIYLAIYDLANLIVPVLAILISLLMVAFIVVLNLKNFLLSFGWLLLSGLFSLFIADIVHPLILLILTFGISMIILYLTALISILREKSD